MPFSAVPTIPAGREGRNFTCNHGALQRQRQINRLPVGHGRAHHYGAMGFSETILFKCWLRGPGSVSYTFGNDATQILVQLAGGDTIELINNSVSSGPNAAFTERLDGGRAV